MVDFLFADKHFLTTEPTTRTYYWLLVASNVFYLVLAALNQCKRARGMQQLIGQAGVNWNLTPQLLLTGMYQPPMSAFTRSYGK